MKLKRFVAENNQKAMAKITAALGADALIYSTKRTDHGVEILAGLPLHEETMNDIPVEMPFEKVLDPQPQKQAQAVQLQPSSDLFGSLAKQLKNMEENITQLAKQINNRLLDGLQVNDDESGVKRNFIYYHLSRLGFRGRFCQLFTSNYLRFRKHYEHVDHASIENALLKYIKTDKIEFIDERNVCALIGPTGVGKTTTIAKLAKRYVAKYGADSIGIITTDYHDVAEKNRLFYNTALLGVDLEYVNSEEELKSALNNMRNKNLVLIDTHGISQRDMANVNQLISLLESQSDKISAYLTLPCNIQEPILDEIARAFSTPLLAGCIFTKQDECISMAPALSISINYKMKIAYVCNGQDLQKDISTITPDEMLHQITQGCAEQKKLTEENLLVQTERLNSRAASRELEFMQA